MAYTSSVEHLAIVAVAVAIAAGAALQTAAGFGFGMFCVPVFLWAGLEPPDAVGMLVGVTAVQTARNLWRERAHMEWKPAVRITLLRVPGMPLGLWALTELVDGDVVTAKAGVGFLLLAFLAIRATVRPRPRDRVAPAWAWLAGIASGATGTMAGIGGPPLVLYALAHDWPPDRVRRFIWASFLMGGPVIVAVLWARFGLGPVMHYGLGILATPFIWVGTELGRRLAQGWSRPVLDRVAYTLLFAIGCIAVTSP